MVVAVFGGSFDPPHIGHAMVAQWVLLTGQAREVWLVPTVAHALKERGLSPYPDRCEWADRMAYAIDGNRVVVSTIEETLPQPSYMHTTLVTLAEQWPDVEFRLLIGSDILSETYRWHRWEDIEERFNPIVANRASFKLPYQPPVFPNINSTAIRRHLRRKEKGLLTHLVPKAVLDVLPTSSAYWLR